MSEHILDARGLMCPLPVLKTRKALREAQAGTKVVVLTTDPAAALDFEALCAATGDELIGSGVSDGVWRFEIRRSGN